MVCWRCEVCNSGTDISHRARHLRTAKHIRNLNNIHQQEEQENDVFNFDDSIFEPTNKKKKFKCKKCHIKADDLDKHLKSFTHEKKVNPAMRVFDEVYGPLNQNQSSIILRCKICDEEIKYINRYRHIKSISHKEKELSYANGEIEVFKSSLKKRINTIRFYNKKGFKTQLEFFQYFKDKIEEFIKDYLEELNSVKIKLILKVQFRNINTSNEIDHFLHSTYSSVFKSDDISKERIKCAY
jgi:hypothetical protein